MTFIIVLAVVAAVLAVAAVRLVLHDGSMPRSANLPHTRHTSADGYRIRRKAPKDIYKQQIESGIL